MVRFFARASIRRRLIVQLLVVAAILSMAFFWIVQSIAEHAATDTQDSILLASATSIADALYSDRGRIGVELPYSALSMLGEIGEERVFYRIVAGEKTLTGYDDLPLPKPAHDPVQGRFATFQYRGEEVRSAAVVRAVSIGGDSRFVTVVVAQTRLRLEAISARISGLASAMAIGFFLLAIALSLLAAQSTLSPLRALTQSVTRRGPNDLRPVETWAPSELVPLVDALNSLLERLGRSLIKTENFIAEAAHRMRTPLTTVRAQAEVALRITEKPTTEAALRNMIRAVDESSRSAGQLLDHAMVTFRTDHLVALHLDIKDIVDDVCRHTMPTAELKDIQIELHMPQAAMPFKGDPILLQNAFRNLLDNAVKYSPADSTITVRITDDDPYKVSFVDEGRGFGDADVDGLVERFSRGTNVDDIVGSGLGLTIADEVVRAHGGSLEITSNTEGPGACVSLLLPRS